MTSVEIILAILGMAAVTYAVRAGGLFCGSRLPHTGRWRRALNSLPGTVLVSICVPGVIEKGPVGFVAAGATLCVAFLTRSLLLAMATGVGVVALANFI